jgi:hypothetical protein
VKSSKGAIHSRSRKIFGIRFDDNENQSLTSFPGLVTYQHLCQRLGLKERLKHCFASMKDSPIYGHHMIVMPGLSLGFGVFVSFRVNVCLGVSEHVPFCSNIEVEMQKLLRGAKPIRARQQG